MFVEVGQQKWEQHVFFVFFCLWGDVFETYDFLGS